jgi:hypothetical protein
VRRPGRLALKVRCQRTVPLEQDAPPEWMTM